MSTTKRLPGSLLVLGMVMIGLFSSAARADYFAWHDRDHDGEYTCYQVTQKNGPVQKLDNRQCD